MLEPPNPADEVQRLAEVREVCDLNPRKSPRFDRISRVACAAFNVPVAMVAWMDETTQYIESVQGVELTTAPRNLSFCGHTIYAAAALVVPDTLADDRFRDNPWVTDGPKVRFYAGYPIRGPRHGRLVGTVCLYDMKPRLLSPDDLILFRDIAMLTEEGLAIHASGREVRRLERKAGELAASIDNAPVVIYWTRSDGEIVYVNHMMLSLLGYETGQAPTYIDDILVTPEGQSPARGVDGLGPDGGPIQQKIETHSGKVITVESIGVPGEYDGEPVVRWTLSPIASSN